MSEHATPMEGSSWWMALNAETPAACLPEGRSNSYATVRRVEGGSVHFWYCDFSGRGNEMWSGKDTLTLADFHARYPTLRGRESGEIIPRAG